MRNETPHPAQQHLDGPSECVGNLGGAPKPQAIGSAVPFHSLTHTLDHPFGNTSKQFRSVSGLEAHEGGVS